MHSDVQTVYLFQCGNEDLFAVSYDKTGGSIPRSSCACGWLLRQDFQLGMQNLLAAPVDPEPIIPAWQPWATISGVTLAGRKERLTGCERQHLRLPSCRRRIGDKAIEDAGSR